MRCAHGNDQALHRRIENVPLWTESLERDDCTPFAQLVQSDQPGRGQLLIVLDEHVAVRVLTSWCAGWMMTKKSRDLCTRQTRSRAS